MGKSGFTHSMNLKNGEKHLRGRWKEDLSRWGLLKPGKSFRQQDLSRTEYDRLSFREWLLYSAVGVGLCGLISYTYYRSFPVFLCMLPLGFCYPLYQRKELKKRKQRRFLLEFRDGITMLSSSLNAGYSVENAFRFTVKELEQLHGKDAGIVGEFGRITAGLSMNQPVELLLTQLAERSGLEEVRNFSQVFFVAKRSGGELAKIMDHTSSVIRDQVQVQEEIMTMTAQRRLEQTLMNGIPYFLVIYLDITSPGFFSLMYDTAFGRLVMTICLIVHVTACQVSKKILDIRI